MPSIQEKLNSPDYLPPIAHRRNHRLYELVAYVNCLLGCRISRNAEAEKLFISRIETYMAEHSPSDRERAYYDLVRAFVAEKQQG